MDLKAVWCFGQLQLYDATFGINLTREEAMADFKAQCVEVLMSAIGQKRTCLTIRSPRWRAQAAALAPLADHNPPTARPHPTASEACTPPDSTAATATSATSAANCTAAPSCAPSYCTPSYCAPACAASAPAYCAASAPAAATGRKSYALAELGFVFLVEDIKRPQADVGDFLLIESNDRTE